MKLYYQDLQQTQQTDEAKAAFVLNAIRQYMGSFNYHMARDAFLYYNGENPTIYKYDKLIYDAAGNAVKDIWSANHKLSSRFFGFAVDQLASYLLGNGVTFGKESTKKRLGKDFDQQMFDLSVYAQAGGVSYGFFNLDHVEKYKATEFVPLEDAENGALMAGVRFWQVGDPSDRRPLRATLFEMDGYTEYIQRYGQDITLLKPKRPYVGRVSTTEIFGAEPIEGRNYPGFPVVPWKNNDEEKSELVGKRTTLDAYDLAVSNMVNNVSEGNLVYWVLQNCAGMDEVADAEFLRQVLSTHVVHPDGGSDSTAEPHTIEAPFQGTQATVEMLRKKLFADFQAFDSEAVSAGNQTATAIKACYEALDLKANKHENQATRFVRGILQVAGIDDEPTYTRSRIANVSEEIQNIILAQDNLPREYLVKKIVTLLGDADLYDEVMGQLEDEEMRRMDSGANDQEGEEDESNGEAGSV